MQMFVTDATGVAEYLRYKDLNHCMRNMLICRYGEVKPNNKWHFILESRDVLLFLAFT